MLQEMDNKIYPVHEQCFRQAGRFATKGDKPLWATVCFFD